MQFRAPLMIEHRLIEKMIYIINKIINQAESTQIIDTRTVDVVVDFIKTYADKTHHGKEEDILFKDLSEKRMTDEDDKLMKELIEEHLFGRSMVRELVDSKNQYVTGDKTAEKYANFSPSESGYVTKTKTITKKVGFFGLEQKQIVEKIKEPTKAEKILREIGALGDPPGNDIQKYFAFEVPRNVSTIPSVFKDIIKQTDEPLGRILTLNIKPVNNIIHGNHFRDSEVLYCKDCELRKECSKPVMPSKGLHNVMIIGEAPGRNEDIEGKGFVGKAGDLLWKTIKDYGYSRRSFHVTNVCKCWPSITKTPKTEHIQACSKWLDSEIRNLNSKICLALGNIPLKYFKGEDGGIMKLCGTTEWIDEKDIWVCWGLHPSAVLRNPQNKKMFLDGIENFMNKIEILGGMK